jgi:hypothetical protein
MGKVRVLSRPKPPRRVATKRPAGRFQRNWDLLAVLLLVLASMPATFLSSRTLHISWQPGLFDASWLLDTVFKASRGLWSGRDVAFNWGPLFQWLSSAPSRWMGLSMGVIYDTYNTLPLWCGFCLIYLAVRLLLPEQSAWKRFLLLVLLSVFWWSFDLRQPLIVFLFAVFLRGWYAVRQGRLRPWLLGGGAALLCATAFLIKADAGTYGIAALLLSLGGVLFENWRERPMLPRYVSALVAFGAGFSLLLIAINSIMRSAFDFSFWKESLAFVSGFRWSAASPMLPADGIYLLASSITGAVIFLLRWLPRSDSDTVIAARPGFLLSAFAFAVLALQTALVRADHSHVVFAAFPMLFLAGIALFSFRSRVASAAAMVSAVLCSVLFATPGIRPSSIRYRYAQMQHPIATCPSGYSEVDRTCYPVSLVTAVGLVSSYLQENSRVLDSVVVFPYQYLFAVAARRNVADGVEQSFLAADPYLRQLNVAGLEKASAPVGLYFPDGNPNQLRNNFNLSSPIDEVPNFTRNPEVWFWIFRHYHSQQQLLPGIFGLRKDDSREARISSQTISLNLSGTTYSIAQRSSALDLTNQLWPLMGADFLRLRLTVRYGPLWKLRKPERMQLEISRADGSRDLKSFVLQPNVATDVWFYPWNETDLGNYFADDESRWRQGERPAITRLRILLTPLDCVSQEPESVDMESADAVRFSMTR